MEKFLKKNYNLDIKRLEQINGPEIVANEYVNKTLKKEAENISKGKGDMSVSIFAATNENIFSTVNKFLSKTIEENNENIYQAMEDMERLKFLPIMSIVPFAYIVYIWFLYGAKIAFLNTLIIFMLIPTGAFYFPYIYKTDDEIEKERLRKRYVKDTSFMFGSIFVGAVFANFLPLKELYAMFAICTAYRVVEAFFKTRKELPKLQTYGEVLDFARDNLLGPTKE